MLPTLALVIRGHTVDYVVGFQDLGNTDSFSTEALAQRLLSAGLLLGDAMPAPKPVHTSSVRQSLQAASDDESSDFSE